MKWGPSPACPRVHEGGPPRIDADKAGYATYWNELVPRVRPGGVILVDNVLWSGRVVDPRSGSDRAIAAFNDMARNDPRVDLVILPLADGLTMARRQGI